MSLFFVAYIDYLRNVFKNTAVEWDVKTITAGDYSVEVQISKKMWETFLTTVYNSDIMKSRLA